MAATVLIAACATPTVNSQDALDEGRRAYEKHCAECHADEVGRPGTQQLGWTRGEALAVLEERTDLSAEYIRAVVRNGLFEMTPFFPSELPDAELDALAEYLTR
jgi:mono/diheme cytochrome c family protein